MKSLTEKYAEFATQLKINDIPSVVRERACELILDSLGVGIAGAASQPAKIARGCMEAQTSFKEATLWGTREKSSIYGAAFVNGTSCHAYDYDDTHNWAEIHISSILVPCLLALAEKVKISGLKMIEVYTASYEMLARIGVIGNATILYGKGFHPSGIWGPLGSALATGLIMGLDKPSLVNALGVAGSYSSGLLEFQYDGSMTKRFHPGLASWHGMTAAFLAKDGFTGPATIIEGKKGCINAFTCDFGKIDLALKGLGTYFELLETHVKMYACVSGFSASIECLITIMNNNEIDPDQIEAIDVGVRELTMMWTRPPEEKPNNILSAQMNLPYCLAVAAYDKDVKLSQFSDERLKDPKILAFMDRIKISADKELTDLNKEDFVCLPGRVTVMTKDGRIFKHQLKYAKDSRGNRATRAELQKKFLDLSGPIIGVGKSRSVSEMAYNLETLDDISKLVRLCRID